MAVTMYLYSSETRHGVMVGQYSMGAPSGISEPEWVITLFCLAHENKHLVVTAEPELEHNWREEYAAEYYRDLTGEAVPDAWKRFVK
ncbi:hypothetical protein LT708_25110 [Pseudomonas syringae pv. syringae]|uniref:hypothetical protein n=1 Tax=Pseudomonas syringae TaxID=317 RepID=UPI00200A5B60|nr:hypothetical protein [Pseudomonas syringae]MCK9759874.1 hypothetical protein [Pseudomonas syringae pv. syringae]MCK9774865.1 hypothetical protein [Pseudomonas syringae pv. syringae]